MKEIKCVIFDMDGVIIDSELLHKKAYYETFVSLGLDVSENLYKTLTGSSTINAFQRLIAHFNLDEDPNDLVLQKRKRYVNFFENDPTLHLVNGVEEIKLPTKIRKTAPVKDDKKTFALDIKNLFLKGASTFR